jgi:hypothetical protein
MKTFTQNGFRVAIDCNCLDLPGRAGAGPGLLMQIKKSTRRVCNKVDTLDRLVQPAWVVPDGCRGKIRRCARLSSTKYANLPAGASEVNKSGATYYVSNNTWFQPSYGANGVFYKVVPAP